MNMLTLVQPNIKGQIVIPKQMRDKIGITPDSLLSISLQGKTMKIEKVISVQTDTNKEVSLAHILKSTLGSWDSEAKPSQEKRERELSASIRRKKSW